MPLHPIKYQNPHSLLIIDHAGKLRQLFVPIRVKCHVASGSLNENSDLIVEQVAQHKLHRIQYLILGKWYPYNAFIIIL